MQEFAGKVAVITGAASGIGRAIAEHCAKERIKLVLADIEEPALNQSLQELRTATSSVIAVKTDVSKEEDVKALARKAVEAFGSVELLFNNAGVGIGGPTVWECTLPEWEWIIGVDLWGVIHGIRTFVPIMLKQGTDCHIVNTASIAGLVTTTGVGAYAVSKHGVVALTETLSRELGQRNSNIKVSVLCPSFVNTRILESVRNRPERAKLYSSGVPMSGELIQAVKDGMSPQCVADYVFTAIKEERTYIITHQSTEDIETRMNGILQDCPVD